MINLCIALTSILHISMKDYINPKSCIQYLMVYHDKYNREAFNSVNSFNVSSWLHNCIAFVFPDILLEIIIIVLAH